MKPIASDKLSRRPARMDPVKEGSTNKRHCRLICSHYSCRTFERFVVNRHDLLIAVKAIKVKSLAPPVERKQVFEVRQSMATCRIRYEEEIIRRIVNFLCLTV